MEKANGLDQFMSRLTAGGKIEYFVGKDGRPTMNYPHVHVVHHGSGLVEVVASRSSGNHPWRERISDPNGTKGREIQALIERGRQKL